MVAQRQPVALPLGVEPLIDDTPFPIRLPPDWDLTHERLHQIGELNPEQFFERTADGRLVQVPWPDGFSVHVAALMIVFIGCWEMETGAGGAVRGSHGCYVFPDGSVVAPAVSWVAPSQIEARGGLRGRPDFAPAFVAEVFSPEQRLEARHSRMPRWMDNGVRLGWLVDPYDRQVWIYRADGSVEQLDRPAELSGEDVCVGLTIVMEQVWETDAASAS